MNNFDQELQSRLDKRPKNLYYYNFTSKEELDIYYSKVKESNTSIVIGILFNNQCNNDYNSFLKHFTFTIKTLAPETPNIAQLFPEKRYVGPSKDSFYTGFAGMPGFIQTQNLINLVYLKDIKSIQNTKKKFNIKDVRAYKYPYPSYIVRAPNTLIDFIPSVLIYGYIILFPIVVKRQASESYDRVREMFKLMGLNDWAYFGANFFHYLIEIILQSILLTFLYCSKFNGSTAVFNYTNPSLVFLILLMYGINLILLAILISIPFKRPTIAVIISLIIYTLSDTLVMSVADYCSPIWMNSAHVNLVDTQINKAMRIICGAVNPTEVEWLNILSNIAPAHILRQESALRECQKISENHNLPIYSDISSAPDELRLQSRKPFWCFYRDRDTFGDLKQRWRQWWEDVSVFQKELVIDPTEAVKGMDLPRRIWIRLNRFRTGQGCCAFLLHRWKFSDSPFCQCGEIQTMYHILQQCFIHSFNGDISELNNVTENAVLWLENLAVDI